ncbi:MAG: DUF434 domain-containing protein [Gammaproteobacteria bacterium]
MNTHEHRHRSQFPDDRELFSGTQLLQIQRADYELCWLLDRGYARHSSIKLVGDRYRLNRRQRLAISRAACSQMNQSARTAKCLALEDIKNRELLIDGFNLIITSETAIAGGLLLHCRDGCVRDLASIHGSYRQVDETHQALTSIGHALKTLAPHSVMWLFDAPVSNSARLAATVRNLAEAHHWNWQTELTSNPDRAIIADTASVAVTSDSAILDGVTCWTNLGAYLIERFFPLAWIVDLSNDLDATKSQRLES